MGIGDFFRAIWEGIKSVVSGIVDFFKEVFSILINNVVSWFRKHFLKGKKTVTVKIPPEFEKEIGDRLSKPHKIVQVVWDEATQSVTDAQELAADNMDEQMTANHRDNDLVEYKIAG
jgi:hypothetical protein